MALKMRKTQKGKTTGASITVEELEKQAAEEPEKIVTAFEQRAKDEQVRLQDATDSEFWVALCFQTREQKEEFLRKAEWLQHGDKYLNGMAVAESMGIELTSAVPPNRRVVKFGGGYLKRIIK